MEEQIVDNKSTSRNGIGRLLTPFMPETRRDRFAEFLSNIPAGGLGFHATTTKFRDSIDKHGLDAEMGGQPYIFYRVFDPSSPHQDGSSNEQLYALNERIAGGLEIGSGRARGTSGGVLEKAQPLLVVFRDLKEEGETSEAHRYPTMIIKKVPRNNILGIYTTYPGESSNDFIKRVRKDIISGIIHK